MRSPGGGCLDIIVVSFLASVVLHLLIIRRATGLLTDVLTTSARTDIVTGLCGNCNIPGRGKVLTYISTEFALKQD